MGKKKAAEVAAQPGDNRGKSMAGLLNSPTAQAAATSMTIHGMGHFRTGTPDANFSDHLRTLADRVERVTGGDMRYAETALVSQAQTLDHLFHLLTQLAVTNIGTHLDGAERLMRMALRAQNQCRASLETLAEVKNPRVAVFANQANVTSGPQQVNNGTASPAPVPAHGASPAPANMTNELLEADHGQGLDTGAPGQAGRGHQAVEAVGEIHRPAHRRRQRSQ